MERTAYPLCDGEGDKGLTWLWSNVTSRFVQVGVSWSATVEAPATVGNPCRIKNILPMPRVGTHQMSQRLEAKQGIACVGLKGHLERTPSTLLRTWKSTISIINP